MKITSDFDPVSLVKRVWWNSFCRLLAKQNRLTMMRNAVWALSNLCRGKNPPPDFSKVICQDKHISMATAHLSLKYLISHFSRSQAVWSSLYLNWKTIEQTLTPTCSLQLLSPRCPRASVCCLGCCSSMTQTSWPMHAGHSATYLMAPMTKSRLLLTQESVAGWWSYWCKALNTHCILRAVFSLWQQQTVPCVPFVTATLGVTVQMWVCNSSLTNASPNCFVPGTLIIRWYPLHCELWGT